MGLTKAMINIYQGGKTNPIDTINVCFNPDSYKVNTDRQISIKKQIDKDKSANSQVTGPNPQTLSMKLYFDTYEEKVSVTKYTNRLLLLLKNETEEQNSCEFVWGKFKFRGLVNSLNQEFTMFLEDGTPVRANMDLTITADNIIAIEKEDMGNKKTVGDFLESALNKYAVDNPRKLND